MFAPRLSRPRSRRLLDAVTVIWTATWVGVGVLVAHEVRGLARLSDTVGSVGRAVTGIGETVRGLPLVGERLAGPATDVEEAGRGAVASARAARRNAARVGVLLGISIALIPSLPILLLYLPGRLAVERERRMLSRAIASGGAARLEEVLAHRALVELPYDRLRGASEDPVGDLCDGRHAALAAAQLEWLGVSRCPRGRAVTERAPASRRRRLRSR